MKKLILILIVALIGTSCSKTEPTAARQETTATDGAAATVESTVQVLDCGNRGRTTITITSAAGKIVVVPPEAETRLGWELQFNVTPIAGSITHVKGKQEDDLWIDGNSTPGADKFSICVPEDLVLDGPEKAFEYFVYIPNIGFLDPVIIVKH